MKEGESGKSFCISDGPTSYDHAKRKGERERERERESIAVMFSAAVFLRMFPLLVGPVGGSASKLRDKMAAARFSHKKKAVN